MGGSAIRHDCFQHYDLKTEGPRSFFTCDGCKMDGIGPRYVCKLCDDTLHKVCRYPKDNVSHDYFDHTTTFSFDENPTYEFIFKNQIIKKCKICAACGKDVRGFNYDCRAKNLSLHPACYRLDKKIYFDEKVFNLGNELVSNCTGCDNKFVADAKWAYVASCKTSRFHVHCLMEMVHEFYMKNEGIHSSSATTNKVEMSDFDLSSVFESKIKSGNGSTTPEQVFVEFLTDDDMDANLPKKAEAETTTTTSEPAKQGIFGKNLQVFQNYVP